MESIKSNELRIGNLIEHKAIMCEVLSIDNEWLQIDNDQLNTKIIDCKPIPLTEEWLFKFGFEIDESNDNKKTKTLSTQVSNTESLYFDENEWYISHDWNNNNFKNTFWNQPKYVHQLQNIYFALTGEELIIK